jgi:hypothetical protein
MEVYVGFSFNWVIFLTYKRPYHFLSFPAFKLKPWRFSSTIAAFSFLLFAFNLCLCFIPSVAELQRFKHPVKADGTLSFLVVGDWGRRGLYNQSQVALQVTCIRLSFSISISL